MWTITPSRALTSYLELFRDDRHKPTLRNHSLKGKFSGYRSVDVTENWRAIFGEDRTSGHLTITFRQLGTHAQLYRR